MANTYPEFKPSIIEFESDIQFFDLFNLEEIQRLQDLFSDATHVASIITLPDGTPITKPSNFCRLCSEIIRKTEIGCANCYKSDATLGRVNPLGSVVQPCLSGGLWDAGANITVGGKHIANWLIGQVRNEEIDEELLIKYADEIGADKEAFKEALAEVPIMSTSVFKKISEMLFAFANDLSQKAYTNLQLNLQMAERKQAEEALEESEAKYRDLVENSPDAIVIYVVGKIVFVNNKCLSLMGASSNEELIGKSVMSFVHPDYRNLVMERMKNVQIAGDALPLIEEKFVRLDGSAVDVEVEAIPIGFNNQPAVQLIVREITERKQVQETLNKEQYLMEALMNYLPYLIYFKDKESRFIRINKAHAEMFGLRSPEEAIGKTDNNFFSEEHASGAYNDEQAIIQSGKPLNKEEKETWKNRPDTWVSTVKLPLLDHEGTIVGTFGLSKDITDQKRTEIELMKAKEKAEESDRLKSAFLANMSHEIRTPMNGILGFAYLLKEPGLSGESQQEYIQIIEKSGARMLNIINDIIDISKIESGQAEVTLSETNVNDQTNYIYAFFKPEVEQKGLQFFIKNGLPLKDAIIKTDREKIYAILTNLVKNAIKFTQQGSIEFGYNLQSDELEFYIRDSGVGIPKEQLELIFERFRQGSESLSKQYEGSGLGLSISKAYIELLGGKIRVESEVGKGSTFYFTLPYNGEPENDISQNYTSIMESENQLKRSTSYWSKMTKHPPYSFP
ncbi:MAG TPA: PocR ligand-binding domain-containing protein [Bacteroidales bacterium]